MSAAAPAEELIFRRRLREHFERAPNELPTLTEKFQTYEQNHGDTKTMETTTTTNKDT